MSAAIGTRIPAGGPVDLDRLDAQTMGDVSLQLELLGLLAGQIDRFSGRIAAAGITEATEIAHALKGAAGAVGAAGLEGAARYCEANAGSVAARQALADEMARLSAFVGDLDL